MGDLGFISARSLRNRWFLGAVVVVVLVVTSGLTTMTSFLADAAQSGVLATVDGASTSDRAVQLDTELAPDEDAQNDAVQTLFITVFGGLPVRIDRAVTGGQLAVVPGRATRPLTPGLAFEPRVLADLTGHARIVTGTWPAAGAGGHIAVAVPAEAASSIGLRVGDAVAIAGDESGTIFQVAALYQSLDPRDPYFLPQPGGVSTNPIVVGVGEKDLGRLSSSPSVLWTISPDTSRFKAAEVEPLIRALAGLGRLANNDPGVNIRGVRLSGGLPDTLTKITGSLGAVRGVAVVPVLLTSGLGVALIVFLAAQLGRTRREELSVLRARGVGVARLTTWAAAEGAAVTVPAAVAGLLLSMWIRPWVHSPGGGAVAGPIPWWPALLVITAAVLAAGVVTLGESRRGFAPGRAATVGSIIPVVLLLAAGAVSVWRFRMAGSAVMIDTSGSTTLDPVALPAPALSLVGMALLGTSAAALAARATAAATGRGRSLRLVLPARELSRRWPTFGASILLICLAVAGATLTSGYDRTQRSFADSTASLDNAADVRVQLPDDDADPGTNPAAGRRRVAALGGVRQATGALLAPVTIGNTTAQLTAAPSADLPGLLPVVPGGYDPAAVARSLSSPPVGLALPPGVREITVDLSVTAVAAPDDPTDPQPAPPTTGAFLGVHLVLWITGPQDGIRPVGSTEIKVPLSTGDSPVPVTRQVPIQVAAEGRSGAGPVIVAVDTVLDTQGTGTTDTVQIIGIRADRNNSAAGPVLSWELAEIADEEGPATLGTGSVGSISWTGPIPAAATPRTVRLMPAVIGPVGATTAGPVPLGVVVNELMAAQLGVTVGSEVDFRLDATGGHVPAVVASISPVLPGDAAVPRAMADLTALTVALLSSTTVIPVANQIWISTTSPGETAAELRAEPNPGWRVTVAGDRTAAALIDPARTASWMGVGVFMFLVVLALALLTGNLSGERRGEIRPLVASGLTRREWVGLRRRESLWCLVVGTGLGLAVGLTASLVTVSGLARSAVVGAPAQLDPVLGFSVGLWAALGCGAVGVVAVLVWYGRLSAYHWVEAVR